MNKKVRRRTKYDVFQLIMSFLAEDKLSICVVNYISFVGAKLPNYVFFELNGLIIPF